MLDNVLTSGSQRNLRARDARALRWALAAVLLLVWVCMRPPLPAQAVTFNGYAHATEGTWQGARPDYTPMSASEYFAEISRAIESGPLPEKRQAADVQAGSVVNLRARVVGRDGNNVRYARVTFTIISGDYVRRVAAQSGRDGIASSMQRIPRELAGSAVVVTAWADTSEWSAGDYQWFRAQ